MAMSTGAKVAIGCGIAVIAAGGVLVIGLGAGAYWLKGKVEKSGADFTAMTNEIEKHRRQANANRFTPPADGVIDEARLVKFLDVRKQVYEVYERHKPEFEAVDAKTKDKQHPGFGEIVDMGLTMGRLVADVQLVQEKALAGVGMSDTEYRYVQAAVYKTAWAAPIHDETGKQPGEFLQEGLKQQKDALREAAEKARAAGVKVEEPSEAEQEKAREAVDEAAAQTKALDVPKGNLALFKKYEADIKKYAMSGLAGIGL
jgi:hypothetical protein